MVRNMSAVVNDERPATGSVNEQKEFIKKYLENNFMVDVTNSEFQDAFYKRFGGKRVFKFYGAMPVPRAQRRLAEMYHDGILSRNRIGLGDMAGMGFPKWVWCYRLR